MAALGGTGSIRISVWDPDGSGFSLHSDLLHACLSVYWPRLPLGQSHTSITPAGPHAHTWHTHNRRTRRTELKGESCIFSDVLN